MYFLNIVDPNLFCFEDDIKNFIAEKLTQIFISMKMCVGKVANKFFFREKMLSKNLKIMLL